MKFSRWFRMTFRYVFTEKVKNIIIILLIIVGMGIVALMLSLFVLFIIHEHSIIVTSNILEGGIGAFFGAFFAFLFLILANTIKHKKEANISHYEEIEKIIYTLVDINVIIAQLIKVFTHYEIGLRRGHHLTISEYQVPNLEIIYMKIKNLDLRRDAASFHFKINLLNNSLRSSRQFYYEILNDYKTDQNYPSYEFNLKTFEERTSAILNVLKKRKLEINRLLRNSNILRKKSFLDIFYVKKSYPRKIKDKKRIKNVLKH